MHEGGDGVVVAGGGSVCGNSHAGGRRKGDTSKRKARLQGQGRMATLFECRAGVQAWGG
jgi:hypothetical protein